jgi:dihydroorotase
MVVSLPSVHAATRAKQVINVKGLVVTPGLIDIHVHLFHTTGLAKAWAGDYSIQPDAFSFRTGVTTMLDAGSAGWRNFDEFRRTVIDRVQTRVFALINVAGKGMSTNAAEQLVDDMLPEKLVEVAKRNSDVVIGVKCAHYEGPDWSSVDRAVQAGRLANLPVMVDFGYFLLERPYWQLVTERLRKGDITTHCYRSGVPWVDEMGRIYDYLHEARQRGVVFDVGHGGGSFVFRNAVPAIAKGFYPDTISTDLHATSMNVGMQDMTTTMSKFLVLGMPLADVIDRSTWKPAQVLSHPELGNLSVGAIADVAVLSVQTGTFGYTDSSGGYLAGRQRIFAELTFKDGKLMWDWNGRAATDYKKLGPRYGLRPNADYVVLPPADRKPPQ